jgi:hypothetical protein
VDGEEEFSAKASHRLEHDVLDGLGDGLVHCGWRRW